jgi:CheY-like chemotaxis protein
VAATDAVRGPRSFTVVLADNDREIVDLVSMDLRLEGFEVVATAMSGEAAVAACEEHRPDVLVVDYRMPPGWNGIETIERVSAAGTAGAYILYTNYRAPEISRRAAKLGAIFLSKGTLRVLRTTLYELAARAD